jgi:hypothetical protein
MTMNSPCLSPINFFDTDIVKQLELFPPQKPTYSGQPSQLEMSADALHQWKQRIFEYQQSASSSQPQQQTLFELAPDPCDTDTFDPFSLQLHNLSFCEKPDWGDGFAPLRYALASTLRWLSPRLSPTTLPNQHLYSCTHIPHPNCHMGCRWVMW